MIKLDCHAASLPGMVPTAVQRVATVVEQERLARDTYRLRLRCPEIAAQITPGQFFMIRPPRGDDPLLGRPFALYDTYEEHGQPAGVDFGYVVIGKLTRLMPQWRPGDEAEIWGPLGNGFPLPPSGHLMIVAGGIGQTPFLAVIREALGRKSYGRPARVLNHRLTRITMCYGVRSADCLAGVEDFTDPGVDLRLATDDGTRGHRGFVTDLLTEAIARGDAPDAVYCCGPEAMMHATAAICRRHRVPCWLSLESPMACGFGACFSCVTRVRTDDGWDYRRTCVEGPIFSADQLAFAES
jgi:dihydroorotate dehydrogenase electron transfer subunit